MAYKVETVILYLSFMVIEFNLALRASELEVTHVGKSQLKLSPCRYATSF